MALPKIKIKSGDVPQLGVLTAVLPEPEMEGLEKKISFNNRHAAVIETGLDIEVEVGYKLCFSVHRDLAEKGMVVANSPGNVQVGTVSVCLVNCGREIIDIREGDPIAICWVEPIQEYQWVKKP